MTSGLFATEIRPRLSGRSYSPAGVYISVNGTADPSPDDPYNQLSSFASDIAQLLMGQQDGLWASQPIGYPAAVQNMRASYMSAYDQIIAALGGPPSPFYQAPVYPSGPFTLGGYSQGACATDLVWQQAIYPEGGVLHHRINDCMAVINFGDVFRAVGVANGNIYQGIPLPPKQDGTVTGGIGGATYNLTEAQSTYINPTNPTGRPVVMSWALKGDLYGSSPQGAAGAVGQSIMKIIFDTNVTNVIEIAKDLGHPIGIVEEIVNALGFFGAGTNAPHWQYANQGCVASAVQYMLELGNALPHQPGY